METEQPDTGRMHRLFDDALDDVDLAGNVVPAVLAGYEHKVKVRRYQSAGIALAVLAAGGAAISALPYSNGTNSQSAAAGAQSVDYCQHEQWGLASTVAADGTKHLSADPSAYHANCEALRTALQEVFPGAQLVPQYNADLTGDPRVDQTLVRELMPEQKADPAKWHADEIKYFGAELKYLAVHPEDPANVYIPNQYTVVMPGGREDLGVSRAADSADCTKRPAALKESAQCTPVGVTGGWHGVVWNSDDHAQLAVLTNGHGTSIELSTPGSHALTEKQWAQFLGSPALQKFANVYAGTLPKN